MRGYIDWLDSDGFWIRNTWDEEKQKMLGGGGKLILRPHHRRILGHALRLNEEGELSYETVLFSCIKKSGKTAISASIAAWYAECSLSGTEIFVIANTQESGMGLAFSDLRLHFEHQKDVFGPNFCSITKDRIDFPNGTFIQVLAQSYKGVAGSRHSLTVWDELWGYTSELDRRVWDELVPIPTVSNSLRFISTYAGFENSSDLLWEKYIFGVGPDEHKDGQGKPVAGLEDLETEDHPACWENGNQFTYWDHEPRMPWQTEKYYEDQKANERPASYIRFHTNHWVTTHEEFMPISWFDRATEVYKGSAEIWSEHPYKRFPITIAIDAGIKHDSTALVGIAYDAAEAKVSLVFHKIWTPTDNEQVDLDATVSSELLSLQKKYTIASVVYDKTHLIQTMLQLKRAGLPVREFEQTHSLMTAASQLMFEMFKNNQVEAYKDEELRRHIQMAVAEMGSRGFRLVKTSKSQRNNIDGAIAMAMAIYEAVQNGGVDISQPIRLESPFSDRSRWRNQTNEPELPFPLRSR